MDYIGTCENDIKLEKEKKIVIFGCGKIARGVYQALQQRDLAGNICCFCDNNAKIQGTEMYGCMVVSVEDAVCDHPDAAFLVTSTCVREMTEQLRDMGVRKIHIIHL